MGHALNGAQAYKLKIVTNLFKDTEESEKQIMIFNKTFSGAGANKSAMSNLKRRMYKKAIESMEGNSHSPDDIIFMLGPQGEQFLAKL